MSRTAMCSRPLGRHASTACAPNACGAYGRSGLPDEDAASPNDHLQVSRPVLLKQYVVARQRSHRDEPGLAGRRGWLQDSGRPTHDRYGWAA